MDGPLVTVVIPVYNGERYLAAALESVFRQDYRPVEVIVVDDGSTDRTAEIAQSFDDVHYHFQSNQGVAVARNLGISHAQGEFIAFLDADDLWMPCKLSIHVDYMLENPHVGYVFAKQRIFLEPGMEMPSWLKKDCLSEEQVGYLPSALLVRKAVFDQTGYFDPGFRISEDSDWFLRAKDAGIPMAVVPEVLLHKRVHDSNLTSQTQIGNPILLRAIKRSIERQRSRSMTSLE